MHIEQHILACMVTLAQGKNTVLILAVFLAILTSETDLLNFIFDGEFDTAEAGSLVL